MRRAAFSRVTYSGTARTERASNPRASSGGLHFGLVAQAAKGLAGGVAALEEVAVHQGEAGPRARNSPKNRQRKGSSAQPTPPMPIALISIISDPELGDESRKPEQIRFCQFRD